MTGPGPPRAPAGNARIADAIDATGSGDVTELQALAGNAGIADGPRGFGG